MEMACVMSQYDFDASIVFMTVAAEEQGLPRCRALGESQGEQLEYCGHVHQWHYR